MSRRLWYNRIVFYRKGVDFEMKHNNVQRLIIALLIVIIILLCVVIISGMQKSPNDTTANVQNTSTTTATQSESSYNEPQKISLKDYAQQNGLSYTELVDEFLRKR